MNPALRDRELEHRTRLVRSAGVASVSVAVALVALKVWGLAPRLARLQCLVRLPIRCSICLPSTVTLLAVRFALEPARIASIDSGTESSRPIAGLAQSFIITISRGYVRLPSRNASDRARARRGHRSLARP